jgi:two-component system OmpR family response regulator
MLTERSVAVVEDDAALRDNYVAGLRRRGYRARGYAQRLQALEAFELELPDLVIIDINLGHEIEGGFELCRALRARSARLPIIFLTARDNEIDAVSGLRLGADDYLVKSIGLEHLLARVAALFRRSDALGAPDTVPQCLERGSLSIDGARFLVRWKDQPVGLTLTEFWIVQALARHPGHVRSRAQLMEAANTVLDESSVTSQIKRIRQKFAAVDPAFAAIGTVYGMGYRWDPDG